MEELQKYIKKYDVKIPEYIDESTSSISIAIEDGDINLVKSIIAYKNYLRRMEDDAYKLEIFKLLRNI